MDQRARMVKTLVCLAVAMTCTSTLLAWLDPSVPLTGSLPDETIIALADVAVTQDVVVRRNRWREVRVCLVGKRPEETFLSATADSADWHFRVGADGRPVVARRWREQRPVPTDSHAVRIEAAHASGGELSPAQWVCLRALLVSINGAVASGPDALPVFFHGAEPPRLPDMDL